MAEVTGFFHGGITVKDMDKSLDFYREGLGLSMKFDRILDALKGYMSHKSNICLTKVLNYQMMP